MTNANRRHASRKTAKHSRRRELRSRRPFWYRPMRRALRGIDGSHELIDLSERVIDAVENFETGGPIRTSRRLQEASGWLCDAATYLGRALRGLDGTNACIAQAPEQAAEAPVMLFVNTMVWIKAAERLEAVSARLDVALDELAESVASGDMLFDLSELPTDSGPSFAEPRHDLAYLFEALNQSRKSDCLCFFLTRRQRSAPATVAEAVRKVTRGRAPPVVSTCSL